MINTIENGKRLRKLRGDRSAKSVAEALGISESALLMFERGERTPRDDTKCKISDFYGVSVQELFFANKQHKK